MDILITVGIFPPDIGGPASFVPKISKSYCVFQKNSIFQFTIAYNFIKHYEEFSIGPV